MAAKNNRLNRINTEKIVRKYISQIKNNNTNKFMHTFMKKIKEDEEIKIRTILKQIITYENSPQIKIIDDIDNILKNWHKIQNYGQKNCGIFINEEYPDRILKCDNILVNLNKILDVIHIESIIPNLFPKIHEIYNLKYTIMEKLNGDLSELCYKILPNELIKITEEFQSQKDQILRYLDLIIPKIDIRLTKEEFLALKPSLFDRFFKLYLEKLLFVLKYITYQVVYLNIILAICGYEYRDNKLDNFSFRIVPNIFAKEHHALLNNKIFFRGILDNTIFTNTFIEINFLDWDSGLRKIDDELQYMDITIFLYKLLFKKQILNFLKYGQIRLLNFYTHIGKYYNMGNNTLISNEPKISSNNHSASKSLPISELFRMDFSLEHLMQLIYDFCYIITKLYPYPNIYELTSKSYGLLLKYGEQLYPEFLKEEQKHLKTNTRKNNLAKTQKNSNTK
jgi:hypothetical protein